MHRPDAIVTRPGECAAIEVELAKKLPAYQRDILLALVRGETFEEARHQGQSCEAASALSWGEQSRFTRIEYYAPPTVRAFVRRLREDLVQQGLVTRGEALRIVIRWYPLVNTGEEQERETLEDGRMPAGDDW